MAHHSFPQEPGQKAAWLKRYAEFGAASGIPRDDAFRAADATAERLPVIAPEDEESMLREAGFTGVTQFYMGFSFRGWFCLKV